MKKSMFLCDIGFFIFPKNVTVISCQMRGIYGLKKLDT